MVSRSHTILPQLKPPQPRIQEDYPLPTHLGEQGATHRHQPKHHQRPRRVRQHLHKMIIPCIVHAVLNSLPPNHQSSSGMQFTGEDVEEVAEVLEDSPDALRDLPTGSSLNLSQIYSAVKKYYHLEVAPSTWKVYNTGLNRYQCFCEMAGKQ